MLYSLHTHYSETRDLGLKSYQRVKPLTEALIDSTPNLPQPENQDTLEPLLLRLIIKRVIVSCVRIISNKKHSENADNSSVTFDLDV